MSVKNINDEISRCIIQMLVSEPFYAHLLSGIVRVVTNDIPTDNDTLACLMLERKMLKT